MLHNNKEEQDNSRCCPSIVAAVAHRPVVAVDKRQGWSADCHSIEAGLGKAPVLLHNPALLHMADRHRIAAHLRSLVEAEADRMAVLGSSKVAAVGYIKYISIV